MAKVYEVWSVMYFNGNWDTMILGWVCSARTTLAGMGSNLLSQWLQKYVTVKAGETRGSSSTLSVHACVWIGFSCLTLLFVLLHTSRCLAIVSPLRGHGYLIHGAVAIVRRPGNTASATNTSGHPCPLKLGSQV